MMNRDTSQPKDAVAPPQGPPELHRETPGAGARIWATPGGIVLLAGVTIALTLRLMAASNEFWLDEVFTYYLVGGMTSVGDAFTKMAVEHHILNTIYMYLLGDRADWIWYRYLSVVTGTASVALVGYACLKRGFIEVLAVVLLSGLSYLLLVYSSEARGYAPAIFFSLAAFLLLQKYWADRSMVTLPAFWLAVILALLSNLTAACVYVSLVVWSAYHEWRQAPSRPALCAELVKCHGLPGLFAAWLYFGIARNWGSVGGPVVPFHRTLMEVFCIAVGVPPWGMWMGVGAALALSGLLLGLLVMHREKTGIWIFYLTVLILAPGLMLIVNRRPYVYARYFVVLLPFFHLMLAQSLGWAYRQSRYGRILCVAFLLVSLTGNTWMTAEFLTRGRGGYMEATQHMAAEAPGGGVTVGGDQDFRSRLMVEFYGHYLPAGFQMRYVQDDAWPEGGAEWLVCSRLPEGQSAPPPTLLTHGIDYTLDHVYGCSRISGTPCFLYRRTADVVAGPTTPGRSRRHPGAP